MIDFQMICGTGTLPRRRISMALKLLSIKNSRLRSISPETTDRHGTTLVAGSLLPTSLARNAGAAIPPTAIQRDIFRTRFPELLPPHSHSVAAR